PALSAGALAVPSRAAAGDAVAALPLWLRRTRTARTDAACVGRAAGESCLHPAAQERQLGARLGASAAEPSAAAVAFHDDDDHLPAAGVSADSSPARCTVRVARTAFQRRSASSKTLWV